MILKNLSLHVLQKSKELAYIVEWEEAVICLFLFFYDRTTYPDSKLTLFYEFVSVLLHKFEQGDPFIASTGIGTNANSKFRSCSRIGLG